MFVHLRAHSCYSFLEALPEPAHLVQAAIENGLSALGLTDHNSLAGAIEFYQACQKAGLRPIVGLELELRLAGTPAAGRIALLACDLFGWSSLCQLVSEVLRDPRGDGACPLELLAEHTASLLCLSGGRRGPTYHLLSGGQPEAVSRLLSNLADLFPGNLYIELQRHTHEDASTSSVLAGMARRLRLPVVASHDIFHLTPAQADLQRTLAAIRTLTTLERLPAVAAAPPNAHFLSKHEMATRFSDLPGALDASGEIVERCHLELPLGVPHFPQIPLPPGVTALQVLRNKAEDGARRLYGKITPVIREHLDHELEVIGGRGYEPIFLIVEEVLAYARRTGVTISSRGSAASSLVAHCLGITSPDPLALNLYFERFLNPERSTPPDIDTDLDSRRRDEVIQHVFETYGQERVAMVGTVNRFRPRSALGDVAKAHGLPPDQVRALCSALPHFFRPGMLEEDDPLRQNPYADLAQQHPEPRYQLIFQQAAALQGLPRHLSVHAGGVVITPGAATDLIPLQPSNKGVTITQFDLEPLEALGLVKIDMLGVRGLTVLGDVAGAIHSWRRTEFASPLDVLDAIPADDPRTVDMLVRTATIGCFSIESPGMRATLREVHADSIEDIMVALALFRPGPLKGGLKDAFVRRHLGLEVVEYLHPALQPLLADTYGVILYQEQVLRIAHELAGMSLAEADLLRRAMSHFDPGKQMLSLKKHFIAGAEQGKGVPPQVSERLWEMMAAFAGYGFPKAHAASYAQVAWRSAWCKAHYPAEFMAAVMANWGGYYSQRVYLGEARRLGLYVRPPHINHARREFSVCYIGGDPVLYMGLDQVRDLTHRTQEAILRQRPFLSLADFLSRADPRAQEAASLARVGALEGFGSIPGLLRQIETGIWRPSQPTLFDLSGAPPASATDWSLEERVEAQEEILGISVDAHPLELFAAKIASAGVVSTLEAAAHPGTRLRLAGMRQWSRRMKTARGETMLLMTLEDLEGTLDVLVYPEAYRRCRAVLNLPGPYLIEGVVERNLDSGEPVLRAERVESLRKV